MIANVNTPSPDYSPNSSICNSDMISTLPNASPTPIYPPSSQQLSYKVATSVKSDSYAMSGDLLIPQQATNQTTGQSNGHLSPSQYRPQTTQFMDQQAQDQATTTYSVKIEPSAKFDLMANTPPPSPENLLQKQLQQQNSSFTGNDYPAITQQTYAAGHWSNQSNQSSLNSINQAENQISNQINQISVQIAGRRPLDSPSSSNSPTSSSAKKLKSEKQPAIVHQHVHLNNIVINSLSVNNSLQINQQNNVHLQAAAATSAAQLNASSHPVQTASSNSSYHCNPLYVYTHPNHSSLENYPAPLQALSQSGHSSNHLSSQMACNQVNQVNSQTSQSANNSQPISRTANGYYSPANSMYLRQLEEDQHLLTTVHPMLSAHHLQSNAGQLYPYEMVGAQPNSAGQFNAQYGSNMTVNEYTPDDYPVTANQLDEPTNNSLPVNPNCSFLASTQCPNQQRLPTIYTQAAMPLIKNMQNQMDNSSVRFAHNPAAGQPNNQINEQNASSSSLAIQAPVVSTTKSRRGRKARGPKKITQHFCNYNNCGKCYSKSSHLKGRPSSDFHS